MSDKEHRTDGKECWCNPKVVKVKQSKKKVPMNSREAITGFVAWLTCRDEVVEFGASKDAAKPAELANKFCDHNNLPQFRDELWVDGVEFSHPDEVRKLKH